MTIGDHRNAAATALHDTVGGQRHTREKNRDQSASRSNGEAGRNDGGNEQLRPISHRAMKQLLYGEGKKFRGRKNEYGVFILLRRYK